MSSLELFSLKGRVAVVIGGTGARFQHFGGGDTFRELQLLFEDERAAQGHAEQHTEQATETDDGEGRQPCAEMHFDVDRRRSEAVLRATGHS